MATTQSLTATSTPAAAWLQAASAQMARARRHAWAGRRLCGHLRELVAAIIATQQRAPRNVLGLASRADGPQLPAAEKSNPLRYGRQPFGRLGALGLSPATRGRDEGYRQTRAGDALQVVTATAVDELEFNRGPTGGIGTFERRLLPAMVSDRPPECGRRRLVPRAKIF